MTSAEIAKRGFANNRRILSKLASENLAAGLSDNPRDAVCFSYGPGAVIADIENEVHDAWCAARLNQGSSTLLKNGGRINLTLRRVGRSV